MTITKYGHCCLLIEEHGARILIDPGVWSKGFEQVAGIDAIVITHEHPDHFHSEAVQKVLTNNPEAVVITNHGVAKQLNTINIQPIIVADGQENLVKGLPVTGRGHEHAVIYSSVPRVENTGYLIGSRFFYPGDAFTPINDPVEILALPIAGPWMLLAHALDYAKTIKPRICFPVHDGMIQPVEWLYTHPARILPEVGIAWKILEKSQAYDI